MELRGRWRRCVPSVGVVSRQLLVEEGTMRGRDGSSVSFLLSREISTRPDERQSLVPLCVRGWDTTHLSSLLVCCSSAFVT